MGSVPTGSGLTGRDIGGFRVEAELGRGAMGVVYRARQVSMDRAVAIKVLPPGLSSHADVLNRFRAEARAASRANHPNLVQVYDVGSEGDVHYMAMELVEGETLSDRISREGPLDHATSAALAAQVASALAALHDCGVVHRDLKPSNILVTPELGAKVTDFGVALLQGAALELTAAGTTVGTAAYMSPEQALGEQLDGRSDVYSLGVVLYEMLAGRPPFEGESPLALMRSHCEDEPPSIRRFRPDVPDALADSVARCLAKSPEDRYRTADALAAQLNQTRLELEFEALSRGATGTRVPSVYSTQAVMALKREQAGNWVGARAILRWLRSLWNYLIGAADRDTVRLRVAGLRMERALEELADVRSRRADLAARAEEMRTRAASLREESGREFDRGDALQAEALADEEKEAEAHAVDADTAAAGLDDLIRELEEAYTAARARHDELRGALDLKHARAIVAPRPARPALRYAVAAAGLLALLAVAWLVLSGGREAPAERRTPAEQEPAAEPGQLVFEQVDNEVGEEANGVVAADLDGDGHVDIVCTQSFTMNAVWMFGAGDGTFRSGGMCRVGGRGSRLAVADLDADGRPDLVVAHNKGLSVLYGEQGGGFGTRREYPVPSGAADVAVADINGDGRPDLIACASGFRGLNVFCGQDAGFGSPDAYDNGPSARGVATGDFDGDGFTDAVSLFGIEGVARVLYGQADGAFRRQEDYSVGGLPVHAVATDLDADGLDDLVVACTMDSIVTVLRRSRSSGFDRVDHRMDAAPMGLGVGDLDGDGLPDVAAANLRGAVVLFGKAGGAFAGEQVLDAGVGAEAVCLADVNEDGRLDIVVARTSTGPDRKRHGHASVLLNGAPDD